MKLLTKNNLCELLQCEETTLSHLVKSRQIPFLIIGREVRFNPDSIETWLKHRECQPAFESTEGI